MKTVLSPKSRDTLGDNGSVAASAQDVLRRTDDRAWPEGLRCDLIDAPVEAACGLISHLLGLGVTTCPIAQVGDRMMVLAAAGSVASSEGSGDLPLGVRLARLADHFPGVEPDGSMWVCWVVPPGPADAPLPDAQDVLAALRAAYAEHQEVSTAQVL